MKRKKFLIKIVKYYEDLKKYALFLTRDADNALDLTQEVYKKAIIGYDNEKFSFKENRIKAWLFQIMKNAFINQYRKNKTMIKIEISEINGKQEDNIYFTLLEADIGKLIDTLSLKIKPIFKLYLKGYMYREIADIFNLKLGTVKSRIFKAKKLLKENFYE